MHNLYKSRYFFLGLVVLLYLIPLSLISNYGRLYMPVDKAWNLLSFGMFCSTVGTLIQFWLLSRWYKVEEEEEKIQEVVNTPIIQTVKDESQGIRIEELERLLEESHKENAALNFELDSMQDEVKAFKEQQEELRKQVEHAASLHEEYKVKVLDEIDEHKKLVGQSQKTIAEQREGIDKKLQQIAQLESKVEDLTYEIKTLIQLAEIENQTVPVFSPLAPMPPILEEKPSLEIEEEVFFSPDKQIKTQEQATEQLKRCIDIAQKITGANYYNNQNSRFRDLAVDNYALDLRRLFEHLRMENASALILYSQKENKVLFANNQSKHLLGWSPDKFVQSFAEIIDPSLDTWKQGLLGLTIKNESFLSLKMKTKTGENKDVKSLLGIVPSGVFKNHVLGVLY